MSHITLPRDVGKRLRDFMRDCDEAEPLPREERTALAALDAALAEPEKERAETGIPARSVAGAEKSAAQQESEAYRTPEPPAKRKPATAAEIVRAAGECALVDDEYLLDFRDGWRAAERFHGITKEDGK